MLGDLAKVNMVHITPIHPMTSTAQGLACVWPFSLNPHYKKRPCIKSCLVRSTDKYALGNDTNTLIPTNYGLMSTITVLQEWLWHYITHKGWYVIKNTNIKIIVQYSQIHYDKPRSMWHPVRIKLRTIMLAW